MECRHVVVEIVLEFAVTVRAALSPEVELIDVRGHEVNIIDFALKSPQSIAFQQKIVNFFLETILNVGTEKGRTTD